MINKRFINDLFTKLYNIIHSCFSLLPIIIIVFCINCQTVVLPLIPEEFKKEKVAVVFQAGYFYDNLNARNNKNFGGQCQKLKALLEAKDNDIFNHFKKVVLESFKNPKLSCYNIKSSDIFWYNELGSFTKLKEKGYTRVFNFIFEFQLEPQTFSGIKPVYIPFRAALYKVEDMEQSNPPIYWATGFFMRPIVPNVLLFSTQEKATYNDERIYSGSQPLYYRLVIATINWYTSSAVETLYNEKDIQSIMLEKGIFDLNWNSDVFIEKFESK